MGHTIVCNGVCREHGVPFMTLSPFSFFVESSLDCVVCTAPLSGRHGRTVE